MNSGSCDEDGQITIAKANSVVGRLKSVSHRLRTESETIWDTFVMSTMLYTAELQSLSVTQRINVGSCTLQVSTTNIGHNKVQYEEVRINKSGRVRRYYRGKKLWVRWLGHVLRMVHG